MTLRFRAAIAFALLMFSFPAFGQGTAKPKASLNAEISSQFPDNSAGAITPQVLRNVTNDMVASSQQYAGVNAQVGTSYTIQASDYGQLVTFNNGAAVAVTLPAASTTGFSPFSFYAGSLGTGTVTVTPTAGTIGGAANLVLTLNQGVFIVSDGTNWQVVSLGGSWLLSSNNTWTGTNTYNADVFFKSGKPWADVRAWGAAGDGVTNDTTAIQNAINSMSGGGSVYFPPGTYCVNGGVSVTSGAVRLTGAGTEQSVVISTCGANVTAITLNSFAAGMQGLFVLGGTLGTTQPAVTIGTSCVECYVAHNKIEFGSIPLNILGSDNLFFDNVVGYGYGAASVYTRGSNYFDKLKSDQSYPVSTPSIGAAPSARANTTGYTTGQIVSLSGYYIQATNNGTTGGSPPSLQKYGTGIVDGTVTWQLVAPTTYYSLQVDTGVTFMSLRNSDHTGPFTFGLYFSNSLAGTAPQSILISDVVIGGTFSGGIKLNNGSGFSIKGAQIANCIVTNCEGITAGASFAGDITISGSIIFAAPIGIDVTAGNNWAITNNQIYGSTVAAIAVQTNRNRISITNNNVGTSSVWGTNAIGIFLAAGTSDYLAINDNITDGATTPYSNGGVTGTHNAICIANVCNTGPAPTRAGDVVYYNGTTWTALAGNNSGTNCFSENASGVPSWVSCGGASGITIGTTTIASGTTTKVLFDNAGVVGEYTISGSGNVAMTTSPVFTTPNLGTPSALVATNATGTAASLTAGNATNTAITDDTTTNATMFPTWVTANTGNLPQKTTSTKLSFNPSTGALSSTSFTGAGTGLTGTAASLTAGNVTTNANLTGDVTSVGNATTIGPSKVANSMLVNSSTTVAGVTCTLGSTCGLSKVTNSLSGDVALNSATYADGPSVAQGTSGTWFASGTVTLTDTGAAPNIKCKLWDGTTVFASVQTGGFGAANAIEAVSLSGYLASPAANIRISCIDNSTATGVIKFNSSGNSMDSTLSAFRIN